MAIIAAISVFIISLFIIPLGFYFAAFLFNIPCLFSLRKPPYRINRRDRDTAFNQAVLHLRVSGLSGWELVHAAQQLVARHMTYAVINSYDTPKRAFERGMGYCWHYSSVLRSILKNLDIEVRQVHALRNRFESFQVESVEIDDGYTGHTWLKVTIDGEEKDVCPVNPDNAPGKIDFTPHSKVMKFSAFWTFVTYFGCPWLNARRYYRVQKEKYHE